MKRTELKRRSPLRATAPAKAVVKLKTCKTCAKQFVPISSWARACSVDCGLKLVDAINAKKAAKEKKAQGKQDRARLLELKPLSHHHDLTKDAVNAYIRARDADQPCISCDTLNPSAWHAGHYMSVGSESALRYDPANIHRQCLACNVHKGSNAIQYRIRLVQRIGLAEVERLEGPQPVIKWTREGLKSIREKFRRLCREMKGKTGS